MSHAELDDIRSCSDESEEAREYCGSYLGSKGAALTLAKKKDETSRAQYVPLNINQDQDDGYGLIEARESMDLTATMISSRMEQLQNKFEPARRLKDFSPPKRFYRTFWRSTSRRILALSIKQAM
jgi:hypothetical protein